MSYTRKNDGDDHANPQDAKARNHPVARHTYLIDLQRPYLLAIAKGQTHVVSPTPYATCTLEECTFTSNVA